MSITITEHRNPNPIHHETYTVTISGTSITTTVTCTPSVVWKWVRKTWFLHRFRRHKLIVGLGVQWRPTFSSKIPTRAATLQLCVGRRCLVFQLLYAKSFPRVLHRFLSDPNATFVGVWNGNDATMLQRDHDLSVSRVKDLRFLAAEELENDDLKTASMEKLADEVLGFEGVTKSKVVGMSDWERELLENDQVQYACVDAYVSFAMGKHLEAWGN